MGSTNCCDRVDERQEVSLLPPEPLPGSTHFPNTEECNPDTTIDQCAQKKADGAPEALPVVPSEALDGRQEYTIQVDRTRGRLGLDVDQDYGALVVETVDSGLVSDWNIQNPEMAVRIGDRLVEVNGIRGDITKLVQACRKEVVLEITFERSDDSRL
eukprot:CAMPEP_0194495070 /NCGR_PEP_ID=MMETSP0253-20130528/12792_1 /TAXON_ID=2966 /ORGANISM="Noctiluca scintillans" /LENGTH=156 /DNA_ID=CAMNT_0039336273 /DNA_START=112 /DNA_END=582 /DNA_ORIENTATION=-